MPKRKDIKKILIIGSGPIIIGQAAEFDYSGTQACMSLKEEGYEIVLVNSNPATIMTDKEIADKVYMEPLTIEFLSLILRKERPDALLSTLGGQTALNITIELWKTGILDELNVELLGTSLDSINKAEDRDSFKELMKDLNEPVPESKIVYNLEDAIEFVKNIGFPVIIRPGFTLGGTGGGICHNMNELKDIVTTGLKLSPMNQCLVEKSIYGYKEIEYEVMRDAKDNTIVVCNMENFDPVGIHTGDSIVFAPSQTLSDVEYQMLRDTSLKIIKALKIEGGCNVQLALDPSSFNYYVIEVNPRVSRSSALASKATGYPIAKIAAKIAIGLTLDEIINPVTGVTFAQFEPALDYVVTKIPRWPFDKFEKANRLLGTQMKATGEVMSIGRNIEESLLKAVRSLEIGLCHLYLKDIEEVSDEVLTEKMVKAQDDRIFYLSEAIRRGYSINEISDLTKIDLFFLDKIFHIVEIENKLKENYLDLEILKLAKRNGFCDKYISDLWNVKEDDVYKLRKKNKILPVYKMVDTCAGEFDSETSYFYSTYEDENESILSNKKSILVIGSGPIRIGQGIEFDYATVHCVKAIQEEGYEAIIINSNPETVSTDFSISNKLYFDPLTVEDIMNVVNIENPIGVIVQFGGQTSINLAEPLYKKGVKILGTSINDLDAAENRELFEKVLKKLSIFQPEGGIATNKEDAIEIVDRLGFPVLIRPSYVLGGRSMEIIKSNNELEYYVNNAVKASPDHPILIDKYLKGKECEVDIISDGKNVLIPGIMEHIESSGVHSGDSMAVYPTQNISSAIKNKILDYSRKLAKELNCVGIMNIQFIIHEEEVYVIEVNPRVSRTVPFLSKVTGISMTEIATKVILGKKLGDLGYEDGLYKESKKVHIKAPVFSYAKLENLDPYLSPEMKSTGEIIGSDSCFEKALYKAFEASGIKIVKYGTVFMSISDVDKEDIMNLVKRFSSVGYKVVFTEKLYKYLNINLVNVVNKSVDDVISMLRRGEIDIVVNIEDAYKSNDNIGFEFRKNAIETGSILLTSLDTVDALLKVLEFYSFSICVN